VALYSVRYVHKIASWASPSFGGIDDIELSEEDLASRRALGGALREAGVLISGAQVRDMRRERDRVSVFPSLPGSTTYWHAVILSRVDGPPPSAGTQI